MTLHVLIIINKTKNTKSILFYLYNKKENFVYERLFISNLIELQNCIKKDKVNPYLFLYNLGNIFINFILFKRFY